MACLQKGRLLTIKDIGLDLLPRVLEFIESIICILPYHTALD
jgi:hypothetical protein